METKNENRNAKSLFLYTALIFLVALLMIILSFFGQNHADKLKETEQRAQTITERASALSDENLRLTRKITELEAEKEALSKDLSDKTAQLENLTIQKTNEDKVMEAYVAYNQRRYAKAVETIKEVNPDALGENARALYEKIAQKVK